MYTFSQIISRNVVYAIVFNIVIFSVAFFVSHQQVSDQQIQQVSTVKLLFSHPSEQDIPKIANQLMSAKALSSLQLNRGDNTEIYSKDIAPSLVASFLLPAHSTFSVQNNELKVSVLTNAELNATIMLTVSSVSFILSLIIAFVAGKLSIARYSEIIQKINQQIKHDLNNALSGEENEKKSALFDLPELNAGIDEIKAQISNHMAETGDLEKDAYIEPLTQLENRTRFVQFFETKNESMDFGVLTITRCSELQTINQIHGYNEGDNYICNVANIIKGSITRYKGAKVFRLNSSDFACVIPNTTIKDAEQFADVLSDKFNEYQQSSDLDSVGYTGLVAFDKSSPLGELLALADTGISVAQTQQINAWYAQTDTDILESSSASYGNQNWRQEIDNVLENQRVNLLVQHIKPNNRTTKVYSEFLARFLNSNNEMLPTASFIAMAEKLDKIVDVDRMIIESAITLISDKNLNDQQFGINLSARSIHDEHFLIWLERRLLRDPTISSNLIFEITEYGLQQNIKSSKRFIDMLHRVGARVTVERFGVGLTSFKFFRDLKPDFIKMDSTYTRDIDEDKNNQYFLRLMIDLAHRLSITVLAESVESQEEKFTLEKLFIDGCQGYYLGKPETI